MNPFRQNRLLRSLIAALVLACAAAGAFAQQVTSELVAEKLVRQPSGETVGQPAKDAKPGDTVVYTATYRNTGTTPVKALVATVPVPAYLEWQGAAAADKSAPTLASTDGATFAAIPLTRKVRGADGKEQVQPVPLREYRALRWTLPELAAGAAASVKVTTKVSTTP